MSRKYKLMFVLIFIISFHASYGQKRSKKKPAIEQVSQPTIEYTSLEEALLNKKTATILNLENQKLNSIIKSKICHRNLEI